MAVFVDAFILALFIFTVVKNWHDGLIRAVLGVGRFIASFILALIFGGVAANLWVSEKGGFTSGILGFIIVFILSFAAITVVMFLLSKIKLPIITKADKLLGLLLGIVLGLIYVSLLSTAVYTVLEVMETLGKEGAMSVYTDSEIFRRIYDFKLFEFIRNILK